MPPRKPTGAETSSATRMIGCTSSSGCQFPHQRSTTTMPKPIAPKRGVIQSARIQPAPSSSRRVVTSPVSPLLARVDQILDERVELILRQARERRHDVLRKALLYVGV